MPTTTSPSRGRTALAVAVVVAPPLLLAAAGLAHPMYLTVETARSWQHLHALLAPVFPLLALGFVVPLRGRLSPNVESAARMVAWIGAFTYAVFYTALDLIAGFAAGTVARNSATSSDLGAAIQPLFDAGDAFGRIGVYGFLLAAAAMTVALYLRHGPLTIPGGLILLAAGWSFRTSHIFWPRGVLTMLAISLAFAWCTTTSRRTPTSPTPDAA